MMSCESMPPSHVGDVKLESPQSKARSRDLYKVETTADGDVRTTYLVEPSFDAEDNAPKQGEGNDKKDDGLASSSQDAQSRSDEDGHPSEAVERRLSPSKEDQTRSHSRNLSAHFFDAAKISEEGSQSERMSATQETFPMQHSAALHSKQPSMSSTVSPFSPNSAPRGSPTPASEGAISFSVGARQPPISPAVQVGGKHRRGISGDMQSPAIAHRRINSIGNSAPVDRRYGAGYYNQNYNSSYHSGPRERPGTQTVSNSRTPSNTPHHQREDSAGLDILTAAAMEDVSKEELARVAGPRARKSSPQTPWEPPVDSSSAGRRAHAETLRVSPTAGSSGSYEYQQQHPPSQPGPPPSNTGGYFPPPHPPHHGYQAPTTGPPYPPGPPGPYHHPGSYYPPPQQYHHRGMSPSPTNHYPGHYSQPRGGGRDPYGTHPHPPMQPVLSSEHSMGSAGRHPSQSDAPSTERIDTDERLFSRGSPRPMAPPPSAWDRTGPRRATTTGVQTHVTAIGVGEDRKTLQPTQRPEEHPARDASVPQSVPSTVGHHRKLSSFSSLSTFMGNSLFPEVASDSQPARPAHHRVTSSTAAFLQALDESDPFLQSLHSQPPASGGQQLAPSYAAQQNRFPPSPATTQSSDYNASESNPAAAGSDSRFAGGALASGGTSKRVRRKCTVAGCPNRVVQGGLCISHGAKRKQCKHPGCTKNVKKAGLCSTHGPARRRCNAEGCSKVAVQGGRCIAHGAKKKLCSIDSCSKQAILGGMCKKHHDQQKGVVSGRGGRKQGSRRDTSTSPPACVVIDDPNKPGTKPSSNVPKANHRRGLSIFQEMSADSVKILLSEGSEVPPIQRNMGNAPEGSGVFGAPY